MCVDEEHVRALAFQATEWHKFGVKPLGSAGRKIISFFLLKIRFDSSGNDAYC
jgi:hypothetical protein